MRLTLCIIISFLFSLPSLGQQPYYFNWTIKDGLPTNEIYNLHLSRDGFLYIATDEGLARYDGHSIKNIPIPGNDGLSITNFQEDTNGTIFFISFDGRVWQLKNNEVALLLNVAEEVNTTLSIAMLDSTRLLIPGNEKIYVFHTTYKTWDTLAFPRMNNSGNRQITLNNSGPIVVGNQGENLFLLKRMDSKVSFYHSEKLEPFNYLKTVYIIQDTLNFILRNYLDYKLKTTTIANPGKILSSKKLPVPAEIVSGSTYYSDALYLHTRAGLYTVSNGNLKLFLNNKYTSDIEFDKSGNAWISTTKNGLYFIPKHRLTKVNAGIERNLVVSNGKLFAIKNKQLIDVLEHTVLSPTIKGANFLIKDKWLNGRLYLSDLQGYYYDIEESKLDKSDLYASWKEITNYNKQMFFGSSHIGQSVLSLSNSLRTSFKVMNQSKYDFEFKQDTLKSSTFRSVRANTHAYNFKDSSLYVGYFDQLLRYSHDNETNIQYKHKPIIAHSIFTHRNGEVLAISKDGVFLIKGGTVENFFDAKNGLLPQPIKKCQKMGDTLVLIYSKGVQLFTKEKGAFQTYITNSQLPNTNCLDAVLLNNNLYVNTTDGLFELPMVSNLQSKPNLFIKYFIAGKDTLTNRKNISYSDNTITITLDANALHERGKLIYEYRLNEEGSWIEQLADNNILRFSSLSDGNYELQIRVKTEQGNASNIETIPFTIQPPFYRTWWFYLLVTLAIAGAITYIFYRRNKALKRRSAFEKQLKQSEVTAIKAQMNPHFIFNALNSVQSLVIKKDFLKTNAYLGKFSDLVRRTLESSHKNSISLKEEIQMLQLYLDLEKLRFRDSIDITFDVKISEERQTELQVPSMLIQPYIENVFKHALLHKEGLKKLEIVINEHTNQLLVLVKDNGIGRKSSKELQDNRRYASFSSDANAKRLQILNELFKEKIKIKIQDAHPNEVDCGTEVIIHLPIMTNYS